MKRFYLAGQNTFGNRGCEALVRSTLELLKAEFGEVCVLVPSFRPDLDRKQWPDAEQSGCIFVRAMPYPGRFRQWGRARRLLPFLKHLYLPHFPLPQDIAADIASCDALLLIGGDLITLDYGIESLLWHVRLAQHAQRMGKRMFIWGASIGPFGAEPVIERFAADFLRSADWITVRETISQKYLAKLGVEDNVSLVADGAFVMTPQALDVSAFWPVAGAEGVLGLNISPLIQKFRPAGELRAVMQREVAAFIKATLETSRVSILLLPHVDPLDGSADNSDSHYMREILAMTGSHDGRLKLAPDVLNAAQLKYVLSQCMYFIGARTHATIGALSCLVPTVSIAYSIKAKGLNRDLFGSEEYVLETPAVSQATLMAAYRKLVDERDPIVALLRLRIPEWRSRARVSPALLSRAIG